MVRVAPQEPNDYLLVADLHVRPGDAGSGLHRLVTVGQRGRLKI